MISIGNIIDKTVAQAILEERRNKEDMILVRMQGIKENCKEIEKQINSEYKVPFSNNELDQLKQMNNVVSSLMNNIEMIEQNHRTIWKTLDNEIDKIRESFVNITVNQLIEESSKLIDKRIIMFAEVSAIMRKTKQFMDKRLSLSSNKDEWFIVWQRDERIAFKGTPEEIYEIIKEFEQK